MQRSRSCISEDNGRVGTFARVNDVVYNLSLEGNPSSLAGTMSPTLPGVLAAGRTHPPTGFRPQSIAGRHVAKQVDPISVSLKQIVIVITIILFIDEQFLTFNNLGLRVARVGSIHVMAEIEICAECSSSASPLHHLPCPTLFAAVALA